MCYKRLVDSFYKTQSYMMYMYSNYTVFTFILIPDVWAEMAAQL